MQLKLAPVIIAFTKHKLKWLPDQCSKFPTRQSLSRISYRSNLIITLVQNVKQFLPKIPLSFEFPCKELFDRCDQDEVESNKNEECDVVSLQLKRCQLFIALDLKPIVSGRNQSFILRRSCATFEFKLSNLPVHEQAEESQRGC